MAGKKGMQHYPAATKLEAVRLFYEEKLTQAEITALLEIRDPHRVKVWLKQYRRDGLHAFTKPLGRPRKQPEDAQAELERLRMENALLKKYHTELRTQVLAKRNIGSFTTIERSTM
jgi:transposase